MGELQGSRGRLKRGKRKGEMVGGCTPLGRSGTAAQVCQRGVTILAARNPSLAYGLERSVTCR